MYTSQTRLTGLSGLDTETMIKKLMDAESLRLTALQKNKQKLEWKQESYRATADTLKTFQSTLLNVQTAGNIRMQSSFASMTSSVSISGVASTAISVTAGSGVASGTHKLEVIELAKADAVASSEKVQGSISFDSVDASTIEEGFSVTLAMDGAKAKTVSVSAEEIAAITNFDSMTDEEKITAVTDVLNSKLASSFGSDMHGQKILASSDGSSISITANTGHSAAYTAPSSTTVNPLGAATSSTTSLNVNSKLSEIFGEAAFTDGATFKINDVSFTASKDETLSAFMKRVNESGAGVKLSYDSNAFEFKLEGTQAGASNRISFGDTEGNFLSNTLKLTDDTSRSVAQDAIISFNGKTMSRESNSFEVDGIKFNITDAAKGQTFDISLSKNAAGALDVVKKFVSDYNKLIDDLNAQYKTQRQKSSGSYIEPLTDTEKEAMTEKQIENWEANAKKGLNYNDSIISGIAREMRTMLYEGVELEDGTSISLYQIGITTGSTNDGKLVLDEAKFTEEYEERSDDIATLFTKSSSISINEKSQRSARLKDEGLGDRLNDIINSAIASGGTLQQKAGMLNTASALGNDMYTQIKDQEDKISAMITKLTEKEENYYLMFSKLEEAMNYSNSQMSYLQGMLGV